METVPEVFKEYPVFGVSHWVIPISPKAPHQSGNPICCLHSLIAVAFHLEEWLNKMAFRLLPIHGFRSLGD